MLRLAGNRRTCARDGRQGRDGGRLSFPRQTDAPGLSSTLWGNARWLTSASEASHGLLVFADDWGRHPSSCQHLVGHLLDRYQVFWVNTIGTRRPRLDLATVSRGLEKLAHWLSPAGKRESPGARAEQASQPAGAQPEDVALVRILAGAPDQPELLVRQLSPVLASLPEPAVAVTNIPIVADLVGRLPVRRWVYYCVDDFAEWPGLDGHTLRAMEAELVRQGRRADRGQRDTSEKLERIRKPVHLLTHGVDLDHWRTRDALGDESLPWLGTLERPLIVFWGVIDRRMDVSYLGRLAEDCSEARSSSSGPESDPDPALASIPRVIRRPPVPFEALPLVARAADVLVMPYADLPVTRAMQPLKLKEYLATGKPVVVRDLPSTRAWADCLDLGGNPRAFRPIVRERLRPACPKRSGAARVRLASEAWSAKARGFRAVVGRLRPRKSSVPELAAGVLS